MDPFPFEVQRQTGVARTVTGSSVGLCLLLSLLGIGYSFPGLTAQYRVTSSQLNGMMAARCGRATPAVDTPAAMRSIFCRHWPPLPGW